MASISVSPNSSWSWLNKKALKSPLKIENADSSGQAGLSESQIPNKEDCGNEDPVSVAPLWPQIMKRRVVSPVECSQGF